MALDLEPQLDNISWKILKELQIDARVTYAELGRRVGLTTPAVIERVRKLEDAGIITGYRIELDTAKVGLPITAFIRMSIMALIIRILSRLSANLRRFSNVTVRPAAIRLL